MLHSRNSQVKIDPSSSTGLYEWTVDGTDIMYQQWFWMRTNSDTRESALGSSTIPLASTKVAGSRAAATYQGSEYTVSVKFTLSGGAPRSMASDLAELITITNTSASLLDLTFFQYANIRFSPSDAVQFLDDHRVQQTSSTLTGQGGVFLNETIVNTDGLVHHQAGVYPNILNSLNDNAVTNLTDASQATGNATWAFQWHKILNPAESFVITKDLNVSDPPSAVPEPSRAVLVATVALFIAVISYRYRSKRASF